MRTHQLRYSLAFAFAIAFALQLSAATPAVFNSPRSLRIIDRGSLLGVADFNGDQKLDFATIAMPDTKTVKVSVYGGNGDATFRDPLVSTFVQATPMTVRSAVGDIDGNGVQDVVLYVSIGGQPAFHALLGKGDGTFDVSTPVVSPGVNCPLDSIVLADMTGDGRADIVMCGVRVFPSLGSGAFGPEITAPGPYHSGTLQVIDANDDGKRDVFIFEYYESVLHLGNGDGTLQPGVIIDAKTRNGLAADFDGDRQADLTYINYPRLDRVTRVAAPGHQYVTVQSSFDVDLSETVMLAADMNGDSRNDLVTGGGGHLAVWLTQPGGSSAKPKIYLSGNDALQIAAGDFDGDGKRDVLAFGKHRWSTESTFVAVIRGGGDGSLEAERTYPSPHRSTGIEFVNDHTRGLTLSDVTGDGLNDIVAAAPFSISVLPAETGGTFQTPITTNLTTPAYNASFADLNGDRAADVVAVIDQRNCQSWIAGRSGLFRQVMSFSFPKDGTVALGDFNGDDRADVAQITIDTVHFRPGLGDGTFGAEVVTKTSLLFLATTHPVQVADMNGDGRDDMVTSKFVFYGNADGQFAPHYYSNSDYPLVVADFNEDGRMDIVYGDKRLGWGAVHMRLNRGVGMFGFKSLDILSYAGSGPPATGDFNRDGNVDIATGTTVLLGDGAGWFNGYARFRASTNFGSAVAADIDGNGSSDLLVTSDYGIDVIRTLTTTSRELQRSFDFPSRNIESGKFGMPFGTVAIESTASSLYPGSGGVLFYFNDTLASIGEFAEGRVDGRLHAFAGGQHTYTALYGGDEVYARGPRLNGVPIEVARNETTMTLAVHPPAPRAGEPLRIRGAFTRLLDIDPTGSVTVVIDDVLRGTGSAPNVDIDVGSLTPGVHRVLVQYKGDTNYLVASVSANLTVGLPAANMVLTASPAGGAIPGTPVTFAASFPADATLAGEVVFSINGQVVTQQPITAGAASFTTTLPLGSHAIRASFAANAQYSATQTELLYTVTQGQPRRRAVRSP